MAVSRHIRISVQNLWSHLGETSWDLSAALLHTPQAAQVQPDHISQFEATTSSSCDLIIISMQPTWTLWPHPWLPLGSLGQLSHLSPCFDRGARHGRLSWVFKSPFASHTFTCSDRGQYIFRCLCLLRWLQPNTRLTSSGFDIVDPQYFKIQLSILCKFDNMFSVILLYLNISKGNTNHDTIDNIETNLSEIPE